MTDVSAIVLAAGRSTRMGQPKMLLPFHGTTIICHVVREIARSGASAVGVVIRQGDTSVTQALNGLDVEIIENPDVDRGMLSSIRCGLEKMPDASHYLIALGDMPLISAAIAARLLEAHGEEGKITVPAYEGRSGHPVVITAKFRDEILTRHDDEGLRGFMRAYPNDIRLVPVETDGIHIDLDTPGDYHEAVARGITL